jgi:hypothetical protein
VKKRKRKKPNKYLEEYATSFEVDSQRREFPKQTWHTGRIVA